MHRRRKILALAAGGLVLGVGATATIAAWTDETYSTAQFEAGAFAIEANVDGTWQSTNTMQFTAEGWFPGESETALVLLRTSPDTTVDGELTVTGQGATGGLAPHLQYRATGTNLAATEAADFACPATLDSSSGFIFGGQNSYARLAQTAAAGTTHVVAASQADVVAYCFEMRLDPEAPNEAQNTAAEHTWTFYAESIVPD
ncbi:SipW-dependent-type signal peptide-containing protein [Enteractinococcus helveticum]|uniref:Acyl-CoA dehydrogenase n=1 Tax=Enteractinococcus helveticum TaxID=1837282 RepID=A0A1B7LVC8_9MICC|nr:SipW-dependent-type signal peptide-containing protein [Enteractinococcus helveticum]OAV52151.1 hypothetical protein A6F49_01130 [Enteractinococcus helveticum]